VVDYGDRIVSRRGLVEVRPWQPHATYALLGAIVAVFLVQLALVIAGRPALHNLLFVIDMSWPMRPWTLVTSTLAHSPTRMTHILFNGLFLYFLGPTVERLLGSKRFVILFLVGGAISGVLQAYLDWRFEDGGGALGASGALMVLFGLLMVLLPRETVLLMGIVPMPMWVMGLLYAAMDVLGLFDPTSSVGHYAHLSGLALGLGYGFYMRQSLGRRGLRIVAR
jgi:uncharacterized protein